MLLDKKGQAKKTPQFSCTHVNSKAEFSEKLGRSFLKCTIFFCDLKLRLRVDEKSNCMEKATFFKVATPPRLDLASGCEYECKLSVPRLYFTSFLIARVAYELPSTHGFFYLGGKIPPASFLLQSSDSRWTLAFFSTCLAAARATAFVLTRAHSPSFITRFIP